MKKQFSKFGKQVPWRTTSPWRYLTTLLILLALSVTQVWAETFTMADIFTGSNQSATVTSPVNATATTTATAGNAKDGKLGSDGNYFEIVLASGSFTAASINGYINTTSTSKNWAFQFTTDGGTNWSSEETQANDGTKSAHDIAVGVTVPSGANGIRVIRRAGTSTYVYSISLTLASGGCSAPTDPAISGASAYTEGDDISLTASATGAASATFTWYKGADWATASAGSSIASGATLSISGCTTAEAGTYWCNISNGTGCEVQVSKAITVSASSATKSSINYTNTKGATNTNPSEYTEGVGIGSFDPLADVDGFHFTGWNPASIADDAVGDKTIDAQWVAAYNVSFDKGTGASGSAPASFQKWEGATFELPGQGDMVAPSGKAFDGWKVGVSDKYDAGDTYTMGNTGVEFVAQWKAAPVTIFHWKSNTGTITVDAANGTTVGGTTTLRTADPSKSWGNESVTYNASVADDMKGETSGKELKPGGNANYLELTLTSGTFQEGDVIYVTGYNNWGFATANTFESFDVANVETGSAKTDAVTGSAVVPAGVDAATIYVRRANGSSSGIAAIKVTRIVKDIISTVNTLTDVKVGESSISAANLATLVSEHSLALSDALASAPTITFNQHTVITYEDYSTKTSDTPIPVVASNNGAGKWTASTTIDAVTYTVTLDIATGFAVTYNANGGSGTMTDATLYAEGDEVTVLENTFTSPAANKKFNGWTSSPSVTITDGKFTMPSSAVELSAVWTEFFTITYMDGASTLGTEDVFVGDAPVGLSPAPTKPLNEFVGWVDAMDEDVNVAILDAATTVYAKWNKVYASSVDLEGLVESGGTSADWQTYMTNHGFAFSTSNVTLDAKNVEKAYENWPYQGLKAKEVGAYVAGNIHDDQLVIFKLGHMAAAANILIDGVAAGTATGLDADEPDGQLNYFYVENEAELRYVTTNAGACVIKAITITSPFQVLFDDNGADNPVAPQYGHPFVTLPNATKGTSSLIGWFDDPTSGNKIGEPGDSYTPAAGITLYAHWEAVSTDTRIKALTYAIGEGAPVNIYEADKNTFNVVLPYAQSYDAITVSATPNHANANIKAGAVMTVSSLPGAATFTVVAQDGTTEENYTVNFSMGSKDGVSIIKVATTGGTNKTVTGLYAGDGDVSLSSGTKMDNGKYIGFTLDGTTLQAGDRINVHTTQAANTGGSHIIFYDNMTDKNELYETGEIGGEGDNIFEINAAMVGSATAYVYRSNADAAHQWNGYVDFIEVTRAMNPVLTAITIDGRDGEIDALDAHHFNVTIPYESDLVALTVVPTIARNAAHATTPEAVISNEGAWILGDNTYRVMDKDGDYTDYTITLERDELKYTVSFNTHGGSAVASKDVVAGGYLAVADVPADPEKEDNAFQGWSLTDGGAIIDITTVQVNAAVEFHAVWAAETGVVKLIDAGAINHTNFYTGATMSETPVTIETVDYDYAQLGSTASNPSVNALNKLIAYNATTTKTKVMLDVYNKNTSARTVKIWGVVEGSDDYEELASIIMDNGDNKRVKSAYYEFNNLDGKNRTIYIGVPSSVSDVAFLQVKVVESGDPIHMFGQSGYSINFNHGRLFGPSNTDLVFEGMTYKLSSGYQALSGTSISLNKTSSYALNIASPLTMVVTTANGAKFYVDQTTDGTANETASSGAHEFDLTAGTWYINVAGSNLSVSSIAFAAPRCAEPAFNALANSDICAGASYVALDGTATVSDGGTPTYQWYREDNSVIEGATSATYTPAADGKYYVIAINHKDGFSDNEKKSELVTVTSYASAVITAELANQRGNVDDVVTLEVEASGKNLHYAWKECATIDGTYTDVDGAADAASLNVTITEGMDKYYKVVVSSDCGEAQESVANVMQFVAIEQANVTQATVWDWTKAASVDEIKLTSTTSPKKNEGFVMANGAATVYNNANFESDKLYLEGEYIVRGGKYFQGQKVMFKHPNSTYGYCAVRVTFSHTSDSKPARELYINGVGTGVITANTTMVSTGLIYLPKGEITITAFLADKSDDAEQYVRISKIEYYPEIEGRNNGIEPGKIGTLCVRNNGILSGATLYEMAGKDANDKLAFDEVHGNVVEAGKAYIFVPDAGSYAMYVFQTDREAAVASPILTNGMMGTFVNLATSDPNCPLWGNYIIKNNKYLLVDSEDVRMFSNRAYIVKDEIPAAPADPAPDPSGAPRRRLIIGADAPAVVTGMDEVQEGNIQSAKVLIDGQLFIIRGEKMYDATGRLVK